VHAAQPLQLLDNQKGRLIMYSNHDYCLKYIQDNFDLNEFKIDKVDSKTQGYMLTDRNKERVYIYYDSPHTIRVVGAGMDKLEFISMVTDDLKQWKRP